MKIAKETWIIAAIGVADLVTTIVFIRHNGAQEANPLFRHYWEMGLAAFIIAKMICLLGPLLVLEWARKSNPRFVAGALRTAIVGYLGFYVVGYMQLNGPRAVAAEVAPIPVESDYAMFAMRTTRYNAFNMTRILRHMNCDSGPCTPNDPYVYYFRHHGMWKFEVPRVSSAAIWNPKHGQVVSFQKLDD